MRFEDSFDDPQPFLKKIFSNLRSVGISIEHLQIDHIAFRTSTQADYDYYSSSADKIGRSLGELLVRGRAVGIWALDKPLYFEQFAVPFLEIIAPAQGDREYQNILEHVEFVIPEKLSDFKKRYSKVSFNLKNFENPINSELILLFPNDCNVKFHEHPIDWVIEEEKKVGLEFKS